VPRSPRVIWRILKAAERFGLVNACFDRDWRAQACQKLSTIPFCCARPILNPVEERESS